MSYLQNFNDGVLVNKFLLAARFNFYRDFKNLKRFVYVDNKDVPTEYNEEQRILIYQAISQLDNFHLAKEITDAFELNSLDENTLVEIYLFLKDIVKSTEFKNRSSMHEEENLMNNCGKILRDRIETIVTERNMSNQRSM